MKKKITALALTGLLCASFTLTSFAASTASKSAGAYGTLSGTISATLISTSVTKNLTCDTLYYNWEFQNKNGTKLSSGSGSSSMPGKQIVGISTTLSAPSTTSTVFGTHGIKGGTTAYAVYTSKSL